MANFLHEIKTNWVTWYYMYVCMDVYTVCGTLHVQYVAFILFCTVHVARVPVVVSRERHYLVLFFFQMNGCKLAVTVK